MPVTAVLGLQWGDEGKGKIVDALAETSDLVIRCHGGANAGHTVCVGESRFVLHLVPGGILHPATRCIIGHGVVLDPVALVAEISELSARGVSPAGRLFVSDRAHVVLPWHRDLDALEEGARVRPLGTTGRGIGPAYADKAARTGLRVADLLAGADPRPALRAAWPSRRRILEAANPGAGFRAIEEWIEDVRTAMDALRPFVADTMALAHEALARNERILLEGAQGSLLDPDAGTYPFCTSSGTTLGGLLAGSGVPARAVTRVLGVAKAYATRVGEGPFPTEDTGDIGATLRTRGGEFGATTGRPRRCGWFDAVLAGLATRISGVDEIALTKVDVLAGFEEVRIATAYAGRGPAASPPARAEDLARVSPVFETLPGWPALDAVVRQERALPPALSAFVARIEALLGVPVTLISMGAGREALLARGRAGGRG